MFVAKSNLSKLVAQVESGAEPEIIIARSGKPVARLAPIEKKTTASRRLGLVAGQYPTGSHEEFDADNEGIAALFSGEG
jgi:prevent-host-death family protein